MLNHMFNFHSYCRLSYRRPSMWTAMSWLSLTTCLYTTIPSMGEGLADSTLQKVRLLIWRMVGTFLHLIICYAFFFFIVLSDISLQITQLVASSSLESFISSSLSFLLFKLLFCLPHTYYCYYSIYYFWLEIVCITQCIYHFNITKDDGHTQTKNVILLPVS